MLGVCVSVCVTLCFNNFIRGGRSALMDVRHYEATKERSMRDVDQTADEALPAAAV